MQMAITKDGETKLNNYGQWDGYPSGQGADILDFLRENDLDVYNEKLSQLREVTQEELDEINKFVESVTKQNLGYEEERKELEKNKQYDALTRNCGSKIHKYILDGDCKYVTIDEDGHKWAAYVYTIDLQKRTFHVSGYVLDKTYSLDNLPTREEFIKELETLEDED